MLTVVEVIPHPEAAFNGKDYVILRVAEEITAPAVTFFDGNVSIGTEIHSAGYGNTAEVGDTETTNLWNKIGTCNIVNGFGVDSTPAFYAYCAFARPGSVAYQQLGGLGLDGNSGDGAFIETETGMHLAGLALQRLGDRFNYDSATAYGIFDNEDRAWINSVINPTTGIDIYSATDDDDEDDVVNLIETAFGSDPEDASSKPAANRVELVRSASAGPLRLVLHYPRVLGGTENLARYNCNPISYVAETSTDLSNWTEVNVAHVPAQLTTAPPDGCEWGCASIELSGDKPVGFLRIKVIVNGGGAN